MVFAKTPSPPASRGLRGRSPYTTSHRHYSSSGQPASLHRLPSTSHMATHLSLLRERNQKRERNQCQCSCGAGSRSCDDRRWCHAQTGTSFCSSHATRVRPSPLHTRAPVAAVCAAAGLRGSRSGGSLRAGTSVGLAACVSRIHDDPSSSSGFLTPEAQKLCGTHP